jgi:hypothetical protein
MTVLGEEEKPWAGPGRIAAPPKVQKHNSCSEEKNQHDVLKM